MAEIGTLQVGDIITCSCQKGIYKIVDMQEAYATTNPRMPYNQLCRMSMVANSRHKPINGKAGILISVHYLTKINSIDVFIDEKIAELNRLRDHLLKVQ